MFYLAGLCAARSTTTMPSSINKCKRIVRARDAVVRPRVICPRVVRRTSTH